MVVEESPRQWAEGFDGYWEEVPNKLGKEQALAEYLKIRPRTQETYDAIIDGLRWYKTKIWAGREKDKIEYPERWLKKRRWIDAQEEVR